ncbi:MAG: hypothetical protein II896_04580 [Clostridia bacterium]|nr:hypothetical protein [Clostridia bacterium]
MKDLLPTPEQLAAMAREYGAVKPIPLPECEPAEWEPLCRYLARLNALVLPLRRARDGAVADLAEQALGALGRMQAQISALDGGRSDFACDPPAVRNYGDLIRQALTSCAAVCRELYLERDGKSLSRQLPYLTSLSHYVYSLLLTLAAI